MDDSEKPLAYEEIEGFFDALSLLGGLIGVALIVLISLTIANRRGEAPAEEIPRFYLVP